MEAHEGPKNLQCRSRGPEHRHVIRIIHVHKCFEKAGKKRDLDSENCMHIDMQAC